MTQRGGWGRSGAMAASSNPFGQPAPAANNVFASQTAPRNPFASFGGTGNNSNGTSTQNANGNANANANANANGGFNPFAQKVTPPAQADGHNKNGQKPHKNPFAQNQPTRSTSPFPFPQNNAKSQSVPTQPRINGIAKTPHVSTAWSSKAPAHESNSKYPKPAGKRKNGDESNGHQTPGAQAFSNGQNLAPATLNGAGETSTFSKTILQQLAMDGIRPPQWPANPGSRSQRAAMDSFREAHRKYRDRARKSLIKAGLVDDPDVKKTLDQALTFKGICEDMCPEWEKIMRITEHDVKAVEKEDRAGEMVAIPQKMLTRLARSAAGQEAPLPMDVRSPAALRRSLDYLINDLIPTDDLLPSRHHYLWDRTRAIRRDFAFQLPSLGQVETRDYIYCLEIITRFHITALHLLAQDGFAADDYSEQQEIEQLGRTLLSLLQIYQDCQKDGIECENEMEFRTYYVLLNASVPALAEQVRSWGRQYSEDDGISTALSLVACLENTTSEHGPLQPHAPTEVALESASVFFSIVASPAISYTMACFAEMHFGRLRRGILQILMRAYSRPRDGPKDITPEYLRQRLRFDTTDEAIAFVESHGVDFQDASGHQHMVITRRELDHPRVRHSHSKSIVESKRSSQALAEIMHSTIFASEEAEKPAPPRSLAEESLFVEQSDDSDDLVLGPDTEIVELGREADESTIKPPTPASIFQAPPQSLASGAPATQSSPFILFGAQTKKPRSKRSPFMQDSDEPPPEASSMSQPLLGSLSTSASFSADKKVRFGETTYVAPPSAALNSNNASRSPFGLNAGDKASNKEAVNNNIASQGAAASSWLPMKPPEPTTALGGAGPAASILSSASSQPSFSFTGFGTPAAPQAQPQSTGTTSSLSLLASMQKQEPTLDKPKPQPDASGSVFSFLNKAPIVNANPSQPQSIFSQSQSQPPAPPAQALPPPSQPASFPTAPLVDPTPASVQQSAPPSAALLTAPKPVINAMEKFTKWFVLGDRGFLENGVEEWMIESLLKEVFLEHFKEEAERKRKEEDEQSWAEARKFRTYSLGVTYFYRWLDLTRKRRVIKRLRMEKERARVWNLPENMAKREMERRAEWEKKQREIAEETAELVRTSVLINQGSIGGSPRDSSPRLNQQLEAALLTSGVFDGVDDARAAAHHVANGRPQEDPTPASSETHRLRTENQRRKKHGLAPVARLPAPTTQPPSRPGTKSAKLRELSQSLSSNASQKSTTTTSNSLRHSTLSSSFRSSLGIPSARRHRVTKPQSHKQSRVTDPYWRMKAHGLIQMPNGEYLHESLALPMIREGKRFPGIGDFGLPPPVAPSSSTASEASAPLRGDLRTRSPASVVRLGREARPAHGRSGSSSSSVRSTSNGAFKRKLGEVERGEGRGEEDLDLVAYRSETPASGRKRAKAAGVEADGRDEVMDEIGSLLAEMRELVK